MYIRIDRKRVRVLFYFIVTCAVLFCLFRFVSFHFISVAFVNINIIIITDIYIDIIILLSYSFLSFLSHLFSVWCFVRFDAPRLF